ncbi:MAG: LamG domain-containing protein, partial [Verrucomicrobiales bacterium]
MKRYISSFLALSCSLSLSASAELIGYWNLDDNFDDSSGEGNDGTLFGGATYSDDVPATLGAGKSVAFDGLPGTYGQINPGAGMAITALPEFSISMWVKGDGIANSDDRIFSEGQTTDVNPLFNVGTHNTSADGRVDIYIRNGGGAETFGHAYSAGDAFDNTWHHVLVSGGANGMLNLYIDGVFDTTFDHSNVPAFTPDTTTIGGILRDTDCCNFFGSIDDVAVWNQELNEADAAELFSGTSPVDLVVAPVDADMDGMRDDYEQIIIDFDPDDDIQTILDVLPDDDFDADMASNIDEENVTDPTNPDNDAEGAIG